MRSGNFFFIGQILQAHIFGAQSDQDPVELHVIVDIFFALLPLDLIKWRLRDVDFPGAHQLGHLSEEKRQQEGANVRPINVGIRHDDDAAIA